MKTAFDFSGQRTDDSDKAKAWLVLAHLNGVADKPVRTEGIVGEEHQNCISGCRISSSYSERENLVNTNLTTNVNSTRHSLKSFAAKNGQLQFIS